MTKHNPNTDVTTR